MKRTTSVKDRQGVTQREFDSTRVGIEISRIAVGVIWVVGALIGIWGVACFIGGLVEAGGLTELTKSWLAAVSGK